MEGKWSSRSKTVVELNFGISIGKQEPSRTTKTRDGHGTLSTQEEPTICKPGIPTQDGGNSSDGVILLKLSITLETIRSLMSEEVEIKKEILFKYGERINQMLRNGLSFIKMKRRNKPEKD
jgi:hypothetical protein